jgi:uncharacterized protein
MLEAMHIPVVGAQGESNVSLTAAYQEGSRAAALIAPPHPVYGGRCDNPAVQALGQGLTRADVAVLCFNFRGTGGGSGVTTDRASAADEDYRAAFAALTQLHRGPYLAAGYSFGAASALRVAVDEPRIAKLVLIAPPIGMLDLAALRALQRPVVLLVGDDDEYAPIDALEHALSGVEGLELRVIAGADHFFSSGGLDEITMAGRQCASLA